MLLCPLASLLATYFDYSTTTTTTTTITTVTKTTTTCSRTIPTMFLSGFEGHRGSSCQILSVHFEHPGTLGLQLSGALCFFCLTFLRLEGHWDSSCWILYVLFVWSVRASKNNRAPVVRYCLQVLSVLFGPRGTLGLQLSDIVCSFCLILSGLEGL